MIAAATRGFKPDASGECSAQLELSRSRQFDLSRRHPTGHSGNAIAAAETASTSGGPRRDKGRCHAGNTVAPMAS